MANFNDRGGNNRFGGGGGKPSFVGNRQGRPNFGKKSWGDERSNDRHVVLHKATCAKCGKMCEVPFRPRDGKPVYCKECFGNKGGGTGADRGGDRFPRRDFTEKSSAQSQFQNSGNNDVVGRQLEAMNIKLERLIQAVGALAESKPAPAKKEPKDTLPVVPVSKKSSKKKAVKK